MNYFAMIHWREGVISPVEKEDDENGNAALWDTYEEAEAGIEKLPIYQAKEITIHSTAGE